MPELRGLNSWLKTVNEKFCLKAGDMFWIVKYGFRLFVGGCEHCVDVQALAASHPRVELLACLPCACAVVGVVGER